MLMNVAVFLTIAISAQLANGAKLNVQSSKATGNDIVADQWLVQLKNCSNGIQKFHCVNLIPINSFDNAYSGQA
jgi:hypothetical protein